MKTADAKIPRHIAIIMDGNGRWARRRGLPRLRGHQAGVESVRAIVRACQKAGVRYLTLYAFSVENWARPKTEIRGLMRILKHFLAKEEKELHENQVRLRVIGRLDNLPADVRAELERVTQATRHYEGGQLILALSYGGRAELVDAIRAIAKKVQQDKLRPDSIGEDTVAEHLYAPDIPDPDLMIRTSGEYRLSNFLLWQLSYAELYITDVLWPDFREEEFAEALNAYSQRQRRFGDIR